MQEKKTLPGRFSNAATEAAIGYERIRAFMYREKKSWQQITGRVAGLNHDLRM